MSRRSRRLRPEERELWQRVAASAVPLRPERDDASSDAPGDDDVADPPAAAYMAETWEKPVPRLFRVGQTAPPPVTRIDSPVPLAERLRGAPVRMDHKEHQKIVRGKRKPEARIDLHGMTLARAHPALNRFVLEAQAAGKRLVLVITGKGNSVRGADDGPIPDRQGVLRHHVPHWLSTPPLGAVVLQVTPAHLKHGGSGAYYVYLRRQR